MTSNIGPMIQEAIGAIGSTALGAVVWAHPVGAAGGAIYAVSNFFCSKVTNLVAEKLNPSKIDPQTGTPIFNWANSVATLAIGLFSGWKLAALLGVNMSLKSLVMLQIYAIGAGLGIGALAWGVFLLGKSILSTKPSAEPIASL